MRTVTYKKLMVGEIADFLKKEDMSCPVTQEGICDLTCKLLHYKEEDKVLRPEIFIVDELSNLKALSGDADAIILGNGDKNETVFSDALKRCAPLCERYWAIFIHRKKEGFQYGVFKKETSPISSTAVESLSASSGTILIYKVSETAVLIKGSKDNSLIVHFGANDEDESALNELSPFIKTMCSSDSDDMKSKLLNFFLGIFNEVKTHGHGTLACVLNDGGTLPAVLNDGVVLSEPLNIPLIIEGAKDDSNNSLESYKSLIVGMLNSDGITVFSADGKVIAYRVFVLSTDSGPSKPIKGGARSRAYRALNALVDKGDLISAFMLTQEGSIELSNH